MCDYMLNSDVNYREQSKELAQKPKARNGIIHTANLGIIQWCQVILLKQASKFEKQAQHG